MNVTVICTGKLKEDWLRAACAEYEKRLKAYCRLNTVELSPAYLPAEPSEAQIKKALDEEGQKIMSLIPSGAYTVGLCIEGKQCTSESFSRLISDGAAEGGANLVFIIGSSHGLSDNVKRACSKRLSMSEMTFPHQLARVMLLEQIYRGFQISTGGKYHK